ncbi:3-oxoacyl-[acyl-carrier-protein] synthase 2 [Pseudoalteromonas sp. CIP111854]|uniref:3-oxoacyl-[acyl-carrier-protein] synthase 2 n=1 Tax=Pseudoalteromonas holothuriae TaxID=2963714 RepID=A0A9W4W0I2_9GAMM|nr:beta-ketoacyl-ACP synthase II [Pseudoalteromonas sp. CIP111854]CAH9060256.1 3-oxoacyl-[acyl-carrier-protein] synthase 2 [Pseudoalteromonas sp. CIP111854]
MRRIVVTGIGAISPIGDTAQSSFENLLQGRHGIRPIEHFNPTEFACKTLFASQVSENLNPAALAPFKNMEDSTRTKLLKKLDRHQLFAMIAAAEAIIEAGLNTITNEHILHRIGVNIATGVGGLNSLELCAGKAANGKKQSPFGNLMFLPNLAAGYVASHWNFGGPNNSHSTACAASAHSIIDACNAIKSGEAEIIVAGGAEASVTPVGIATFNAQNALSTRNNEPCAASRPFTHDRDGFVMGEGAACLVLEDYDHAITRGAKVYCEIVGFGRTSDGYTGQALSAPHPQGLGAQRAMQTALNMADINTTEVDYINAHSTSTAADSIEVLAIKNTFAEHAKHISVSGTKSQTGHLLGAAAAIEAVFTVLALKSHTLPYTLNLTPDNADPACQGVDLIMQKPMQKPVRYALSNSFGFGGTNASLAFKGF